MKVLIIRTGSTKVSMNTYNLQEVGLAKALIRKGNVCDIIYYAVDGKYREEIVKFDNNKELKIYWLNGKSILNNAIFDKKKLFEICNRYDIIQVAEYDQYTSYILNKKKIKPVVIYHGPFFCEFKKKYNLVNKLFDILFLKKYLKIQPKIITKSLLAEEYLKRKGFKNVNTIGVGIDKERFIQEEKTSVEIEDLLKKAKNKKIILYIGQLEERRSIDFIIRTYSKVYDKNKNTLMLIIGKGKEEYVEMCKSLVKKLSIENNIIFKPSLNQEILSNIYRNASVFLLPSKYEIFGMVLLEAMNFGVPVITTYNGGSSTLIENKKNGFIINELDENKWCNQIIEILENDNKEISKKEIKTIDKFIWDSLVDKFLEIYDKAIKNIR